MRRCRGPALLPHNSLSLLPCLVSSLLLPCIFKPLLLRPPPPVLSLMFSPLVFRAVCSTKPEICTSVKFKIVPTFSELSIKATGSIITGKTCSSSFQAFPPSCRCPPADVEPPGVDQEAGRTSRANVVARGAQEEIRTTPAPPSLPPSSHVTLAQNLRGGDVVADINRGGIRDPANVLVQPGKDAVRSVLIAIGIDEACRLRPKSVYDGVTFKDKFDKEYDREEEVLPTCLLCSPPLPPLLSLLPLPVLSLFFPSPSSSFSLLLLLPPPLFPVLLSCSHASTDTLALAPRGIRRQASCRPLPELEKMRGQSKTGGAQGTGGGSERGRRGGGGGFRQRVR